MVKKKGDFEIDSKISRIHFEISMNDSKQFLLKDLSRHGTFLNGVKLGKDSVSLLKKGDLISMLEPEEKMKDCDTCEFGFKFFVGETSHQFECKLKAKSAKYFKQEIIQQKSNMQIKQKITSFDEGKRLGTQTILVKKSEIHIPQITLNNAQNGLKETDSIQKKQMEVITMLKKRVIENASKSNPSKQTVSRNSLDLQKMFRVVLYIVTFFSQIIAFYTLFNYCKSFFTSFFK